LKPRPKKEEKREGKKLLSDDEQGLCFLGKKTCRPGRKRRRRNLVGRLSCRREKIGVGGGEERRGLLFEKRNRSSPVTILR